MFWPSHKKSGFTLIETFVAITILMIIVLGPMSLLSRALKDSLYIKDEVIANFLAQEGVELMIDQRNNNNESFGPDSGRSECSLRLDPILGYNCNQQGDDTVFVREIKVEAIGLDGDKYKVTSRVTRTNFIGGREIVSSSIIFK